MVRSDALWGVTSHREVLPHGMSSNTPIRWGVMLKQTFDDISAVSSPIVFKLGTRVPRATHVLRTKFQLSTLICFHFINEFAGICVVIGNLMLLVPMLPLISRE